MCLGKNWYLNVECSVEKKLINLFSVISVSWCNWGPRIQRNASLHSSLSAIKIGWLVFIHLRRFRIGKINQENLENNNNPSRARTQDLNRLILWCVNLLCHLGFKSCRPFHSHKSHHHFDLSFILHIHHVYAQANKEGDKGPSGYMSNYDLSYTGLAIWWCH